MAAAEVAAAEVAAERVALRLRPIRTRNNVHTLRHTRYTQKTFSVHEEMSNPLPLVARPRTPEDDLSRYLCENRAWAIDAIETYGAVLFRGWRVNGAIAFSQAAHAISEEHDVRLDIACSAGPRVEIVPGVFTSNEAPPTEEIPVHHEMAQCDEPPKYVCFYCDVPSSREGRRRSCTPET